MVDRVRSMKMESPAEGGSNIDNCMTECDVGQDYLDCAGVTVQRSGANTSTADSLVRVERNVGALHFVDQVANGTTGLDLGQLVSSVTGSVNAFNALADIRLWIDGPGDGFTTGAVRVRSGTGPSSTGYIWYKSSAQTLRLFDCVITYASGSILPATKAYRLYASDGYTVARTVTDTYTWNGPVLTQKSRSWT